MTDVLFWLWLQKKLGYASRFAQAVIRHPGGARFFYECSESQLRELNLFPDSVIRRMTDHSLEDAETTYIRCLAGGYSIITPSMRGYPLRLRQIENPPLALYVSGNVSAIRSLMTIAVVGTRKATCYNSSVASEIGYRLGKAGASVVSGCAIGIDAAAQSGAVAANGITIGVLGCGLDSPYNRQTKKLRGAITVNGALISEYPPGSAARPEHFPQRNRIISALSLGVLVVQADKGSGSLITARYALEQGRDLFAYYSESNLSTLASIHTLGENNVSLIISPAEMLTPYMERFGKGIDLTGTDEPIRSHPELMPQNIDKLVSELADLAEERRRADASDTVQLPANFTPIASEPDEETVIYYDDLPSEAEIHAEAAKLAKNSRISNTIRNIKSDYYEYAPITAAVEHNQPDSTESHVMPEFSPDREPTAAPDRHEPPVAKAEDSHKFSLHPEPPTAEPTPYTPAAPEPTCALEEVSGCEPTADLVTTNTPVAPAKSDPLPDGISEEARRLYTLLLQHSDTIDNLAILTGMTISMAAEFMLELELFGLVYSKPGGIYAASDFFYQ